MKKVAILQSNYIPWKGYFDLINSVDEFIFYDVVQYTRRDWRNRNKIKTQGGAKWLTIPVVQNDYHQKINETKIAENKWRLKHWNTIRHAYSKAPHFNQYKDLFEKLYTEATDEYLVKINYRFILEINKILGIQTKISYAEDFELEDGQNERLISLCKQAQADIYLSGPAAKDYIDEALFEKQGIRVEWMDYSGYGEYHQLYPPFDHYVSVLDLIFNEGEHASGFLKSNKG